MDAVVRRDPSRSVVAGAALNSCKNHTDTTPSFAPVSASSSGSVTVASSHKALQASVSSSSSGSVTVASSHKALQAFDVKVHVSSSTTTLARCDPKHHRVKVLKEDSCTVNESRSLTPTRAGGRSGEGANSSRADKRHHSDLCSGEAVSTKSFPKHHAVCALQDSENGMWTCRSLTPTGVKGRSREGVKSSRADKHHDLKSWSGVHGSLIRTLKDEISREPCTSRTREPRQVQRLGPKEVVTSARPAKVGAQNSEPKAKGTSYSYELSLWKRRAAEAHFIRHSLWKRRATEAHFVRHSVIRKVFDTAPCADGLVKSPPITSDKICRMNLQDEANESRPQSLPLTSIQSGIVRARSQRRQSSLPLFDAPTSLSKPSWSDLRLHRNRSEELSKADVKTEDTVTNSSLRSKRQPLNKVAGVGRGSSGCRPTAQLARVHREFSSANNTSISSGLVGVTVVTVLSVLLFMVSMMFLERCWIGMTARVILVMSVVIATCICSLLNGCTSATQAPRCLDEATQTH